MIRNIQEKLAASTLDTSRLDLSAAQTASAGGFSFAQVMDDALAGTATGSAEVGADAVSGNQDGIPRNSFTGFFKELQEKRMEELRKEILEEMGLTEEMLAKMDPEARGRIEGMIAKEIQKRMMARSAMDGEGEISLLAL